MHNMHWVWLGYRAHNVTSNLLYMTFQLFIQNKYVHNNYNMKNIKTMNLSLKNCHNILY